jgi:hypothetical protein
MSLVDGKIYYVEELVESRAEQKLLLGSALITESMQYSWRRSGESGT